MTTLNSASIPVTGIASPRAAARKADAPPRLRPMGSSYFLGDCIVYKRIESQRRPSRANGSFQILSRLRFHDGVSYGDFAGADLGCCV
jgi:hypothetical protein